MNGSLEIKLIRELARQPQLSQRQLSQKCQVSLGSIHYCLNALMKKGYVKARNFKNSQNKVSYAYILTPSGLSVKKKLTLAFLKRKQDEYKALKKEIKSLENELAH